MTVAPITRVARPFGYRQALAGEHRLIHAALTRQHQAIDRHALAGTHQHLVANHHLLDRDVALPPVPHHPRRAGLQAGQAGDRLAGTALGRRFQVLAESRSG